MDDLLNFDDVVPATADASKENVVTEVKTGRESLIDLSFAVEGGSTSNLLEAQSAPIQPQQGVDKIEIHSVDPFASGSEVSPSKNSKLPPPLIPSPANPVAEINNPSELNPSSVFPGSSTSSAPPQQADQISLSTPITSSSLQSPLIPTPIQQAATPSSKSPSKKIPSGPMSRLHPIPPAILPAHLPLPTRKWTDPTVFVQVPVSDELGETISKCFSHLPVNQRPQRNIVTIAQALESTTDPYIPLITSNSWYAVASLARNDLIATHPLQVDDIMRLWFLRWTALLKLSKHDIIEKEIENVKARDLKLFNYDSHPDLYPGKSGCMIPFDLLLVISLVPRDPHECIHRLYKIVYPENLWDYKPNRMEHYRTLMHVVAVLIKIPDLELALKVAKGVAAAFPENMEVLAMVGRLTLHIGDAEAAQAIFLKIESALGIPPNGEEFGPLPTTITSPELVLSNRAFLLVAKDKYKDAIPLFTDLLALMPDSASAINNLAMCHLYSGDVGQGSSFLESFLVTHPTLGSSRPEMIFNLTSMYDLSDSSLAKKRALLKVLAQGCGDDFEAVVMKL